MGEENEGVSMRLCGEKVCGCVSVCVRQCGKKGWEEKDVKKHKKSVKNSLQKFLFV